MKTKMQVVTCPTCGCDEVEHFATELHDPSMHAVHGSDVLAAEELIRRAGKRPGNSVTLFFMCRQCDAQYAVHYVTDGDKTLRISTPGTID